jgi:hypothetical protein
MIKKITSAPTMPNDKPATLISACTLFLAMLRKESLKKFLNMGTPLVKLKPGIVKRKA